MHELRHRIVYAQVMQYMVHFWPENLMEGGRIDKQTIYIYIIYVYYIHDNSSIFSLFLSPFSLPPPSLSLNVNRECEKIREDSIQIRYRLKYLYKELQKSLSLLLTY